MKTKREIELEKEIATLEREVDQLQENLRTCQFSYKLLMERNSVLMKERNELFVRVLNKEAADEKQ